MEFSVEKRLPDTKEPDPGSGTAESGPVVLLYFGLHQPLRQPVHEGSHDKCRQHDGPEARDDAEGERQCRHDGDDGEKDVIHDLVFLLSSFNPGQRPG